MRKFGILVAVFFLSCLPSFADSRSEDVASLLLQAKQVVESQAGMIQQQQLLLEKMLNNYEDLEMRYKSVQKSYSELSTKHLELMKQNELLQLKYQKLAGITIAVSLACAVALAGGIFVW